MTTFPLALPSNQPEPQPAVDLGGGTMATLRYATGLVPFAEPVIEQFRRHHEADHTTDGLRTGVGFGYWQCGRTVTRSSRSRAGLRER